MTLRRVAEISQDHGALQNVEELAALFGVLPELHRVLEVGVYRGGSLWGLSRIAAQDAQILGLDIDLKPLEKFEGQPNQRIEVMECDSQSVDTLERVKLWFDGPLDLLFIDGGHLYEEAKSDFETFRPLIGPDGFVALHDITRAEEVGRLWNEIRAEHPTISLVTHPAGHEGEWLGIGVVLPSTWKHEPR